MPQTHYALEHSISAPLGDFDEILDRPARVRITAVRAPLCTSQILKWPFGQAPPVAVNFIQFGDRQ
jgi:hypothetical protein